MIILEHYKFTNCRLQFLKFVYKNIYINNTQHNEWSFITDIHSFYRRYYSNQLPTQLQTMLLKYQQIRNSIWYATYNITNFVYKDSIGNKGIVYCINQSFYYGDVVDSNPHGKGVIFYHKSSYYYQGQFIQGLPHGQGIYVQSFSNYIFQNGLWIKGQFISGTILPQPYSRIRSIRKIQQNQYWIEYDDRSCYKGQGIIQNTIFYMHGNGIFSNLQKMYQCEGTWNRNKRQGQWKQKIGDKDYEWCYEQNQLVCKQDGFVLKGIWENNNNIRQFTGIATHIASGRTQRYLRNKKIPISS